MKISTFVLLSSFIALAIASPMIIPQVKIDSSKNQTKSDFPTNAHTETVSEKQIKASGADNLAQVLQGLVGLQVNDLVGNGSQISIGMRGFGSNASQNSLILINGVPLVNPDLAGPNLNIIPVEDIKKIEIINGSEGVLFGDQAVGGVINIVTKTPEKDSMYGSVSAGSYDTKIFREGFSLAGKKGLYSSINVEKYSTNNYREHNQDNYEQAYGDVGQDNQTGGWNVYYNLDHQFLQYAGALTAEQVKQNRRQAQNQINFSDNNYQYFQLQQHHQLGQSWQETVQAAHRNLTGEGILFNPFNSDQTENWVQMQLKGLLGQAFLTNGVDYGQDNYELLNGSYFISANQHHAAIFSLGEIPLKPKVNLIIGARSAWQDADLTTSEFNNSQQSVFVTTVGLSYQWKPWLNLFVRRAGNYRFPKADENATTIDGIGGLKVQKGVSYEIGTKFNKANWYGTFSLFDLLLNNEIAFDPTSTPQNPFGTNRNLPPTQRLGVLINITDQVTEKLSVGGQYTHVTATFSKGIYAGNHIPFVASNLAGLYSDYHFKPHWSLYGKLSYIGSRFPVGDDANEFPKVPAFTLVDLAVNYTYQFFFASFRVNNIFNKEYNAFVSVNTVSAAPLVRQAFFYPAPGRNFLLTIGFKLS